MVELENHEARTERSLRLLQMDATLYLIRMLKIDSKRN
jgi:hypothetical protein